MNILNTIEYYCEHRDIDQIDGGLIREAMYSDDIELKGAAYSMIADKFYAQKITPALCFEEYYHFLKKYFFYCILNNPEGEWCDSRYSAAIDLSNWFRSWSESDIEESYLEDLKNEIGRLYKTSSHEVQLAIETGFLEHVLHEKKIKNIFSDWKNYSVLNAAFHCGLKYYV